MIDQTSIRMGSCEIDPTAQVCAGAIVGKPFRPFLDGTREDSTSTNIGANAYIGYYCIVGGGSIISPRAIVDDYCLLESRVVIGEQTLVTYRAQICNDSKVGANCIIGGFIGERTVIGDRCRVFGKIVHLQHDPGIGWDDDTAVESSAKIGDDAFIGFDALVIGPVSIGSKAYICAGARVTKNVPGKYIASGINHIVPYKEWRGNLRASLFFTERQ